MDVAIIILNYNDYNETIKCVSNLIALKNSFHIIVVENRSTNNSYGKLKEKFLSSDIDVIQSDKNGGYSYGNNYGIRYANAHYSPEYIVIINPDVIIKQGDIEKLISDLDKDESYAFASGLMYIYDDFIPDRISFSIDSAKEFCNYQLLLRNKNANKQVKYKTTKDGTLLVPAVPGSFFVAKNELFRSIGYFDENLFLYCEERVIGLKCKKVNLKCLIDPSIYYIHEHKSERFDNAQVMHNYKYEFQKVLNNNSILFNSRLYVLEKYYGGKYSNKLKAINKLNMGLLYMKHLLSIVVAK